MPELSKALEENLHAAVKTAREKHIAIWKEALEEHQNHPSFRTKQDPIKRLLGFTCECGGSVQEWMVDVCDLKRVEKEARQRLMRILHNKRNCGNKARKRKARRAQVKAWSILCRHLTREQKRELRHLQRFQVQGQDGKTYEIRSNNIHNIRRLDEEGEPDYAFCLVTNTQVSGTVPIFDTILTQKVLLEGALRVFLETAHAESLKTGEIFENGLHLIDASKTPKVIWKRGSLGEVLRTARETRNLQVVTKPRIWRLCDRGTPEILTIDVVYADATYDTLEGVGWVLDPELGVTVQFGDLLKVPPITKPDTRKCLIKLFTGVPASVYPTFDQVLNHFRTADLPWMFTLSHPMTEYPDKIRGVFRIEDKLLPVGKIYCLSEASMVGMHVVWQESDDRGFALFNLNGICIYETGICRRKLLRPVPRSRLRSVSRSRGHNKQKHRPRPRRSPPNRRLSRSVLPRKRPRGRLESPSPSRGNPSPSLKASCSRSNGTRRVVKTSKLLTASTKGSVEPDIACTPLPRMGKLENV